MSPAPRSKDERPSRGEKKPSRDRRGAILSVLTIVASLLLLIALLSYDAADEANADLRFSDLPKILTGDPVVRAKADTAHNGLGLLGAVLSDVLIRGTIGYAIVALPVLMALWGWLFLRRKPLRTGVIFTNYAVIFAILSSASFGMVRSIASPGGPGMEWSGIVGDFLASVLNQMIGRTGGSIVLVTGLLVTAALAADIDIREVAEYLHRAFLRFRDWLDAMRASRLEAREARREKDERAAAISVKSPGGKKEFEEDGDEADDLPPPPPPVIKKPIAVRMPSELPADDLKITLAKSAPAPDEDSDAPVHAPTGNEAAGAPEVIDYVFPSVDLLDASRSARENIDQDELRANADLLRATLAEFDVELESVSVTPGPVVTLYELVPASGVKISRIVSLENDMALKLAAKGIRIMAPIPGKSAVGVEIPNSNRALVTVRSVINSAEFRDTKAQLPLALGKTISGEVFVDDLSKMPHLLIAGSTGSGKSVGINTILASLLYRLHPSDLKLVIVDPKKIELTQYARLKSHFLAVSPDIQEQIVTNPHNAVVALRGVEIEMEKRYDRLAAAGVRNIVDYNERLASGRMKQSEGVVHTRIPYIIVVIDELADLMITAAGEVEQPIARLAQLARAVGIHLIVATQRPSVDVITGVIKANFPARIAYQVASKTDSRTILDMNGAEQLLGNGDMLYLASGSPKPVRIQNAFISADEVEAVTSHIGDQKGYSSPFALPSILEKKKSGEAGGSGDRDELFEDAARLIVRHQQGSVSLLQRRLKVGYSRAARLVDELEAAGIVGPFDGSKAREVLVETEAELEAILNNS
jgi:DNA segregation ATPase FtsK/SpoIIIE, S-DNA-T family